MSGKTALITGATGMVGSKALRALLESEQIGQVISISRKKTGVENEKLKEIIHADFLDFSNLKKDLQGIDICVYCLAVYQNQVTIDKYEEITCDYQRAFTDILGKTSPEASFVLFGAAGADPTGKSKMTFAKVKGRAENLLLQTKFPKKYILRPGFICPTGNRIPPGTINKIIMPFMRIVYKLFPSTGVYDYELGRALAKVAINGHEKTILENKDIRKLENDE
jgi:uncharacterized protein YbjT (DUF2867 family)